MVLSEAELERFDHLIKAGLSQRTALALCDTATLDDLDNLPGGGGSSDYHAPLVITVSSASTVWEGDHAFGVQPAGATVRDQSGKQRFGVIIEILTATHYRVVFGIPLIGTLTIYR